MSKLGYMPRLDGLRALAVSGVLLDHFVHAPAIQTWSPGSAGVRLFFVLSGFLITSILLIERDRSESAGQAAFRFYGRRLLRLSPALWLAIAAAAALGIANVRHDWWKHGFYLTNFMVARSHSWIGKPMHFWTLSVEEQFYLGWFFVVVLAPRRWLVPVILACIVIGPVYRALVTAPQLGWPIVLLPGQVDSLGLGALLACLQRGPEGKAVARLFRSPALLAVCLAAALALSLPLGWSARVVAPLWPLAVTVASACAISMAAQPFAPGLGGPLDWPLVRHLGRISYGVYVYHWFVPMELEHLRPGFTVVHGVAQKLGHAALYTLISLVIAEASWRLLETPILRLKERLDGRVRTRAPASEDQLPVAAADSVSG